MAVPAGMVKQLICVGVYKVLYGSNPNWELIKDQEIWRTFVSVANQHLLTHCALAGKRG